MPEHLTWFKWEAYGTWIFGFTLLVLVYYCNPRPLSDRHVGRQHHAWDAVPLAAVPLVVGWFIYDLLCRSWFGRKPRAWRSRGFVLLVLIAFGYTHVFSGRGAFIQVGALVGSIMAGQRAVHHHSQPAQDGRCADGRQEPDPVWGYQAKQRSVHNNYLTLPVAVHHAVQPLFVHLRRRSGTGWSWHAFSSPASWCGIGSTRCTPARHRTGDCGRPRPCRSSAPCCSTLFGHPHPRRQAAGAGAAPATFADVKQIVEQRCHVCHSAQPKFSRLRRSAERRDVRYASTDRHAVTADLRPGGEDARHAVGQRDRNHRSGTRCVSVPGSRPDRG